MILTIFAIAALIAVIYLGWFLYTNRIYYFGTENRHKFFAEYFKDFPIFYNGKTRHMKRKLFECLGTMQSAFPELRKKKSLRILEIGAGTGANFEFYPKTNLVVVDPNPYFQKYLDENLKKHPHVELERSVISGAEDMKGVPDHSVDVVVSTIVLCSVQDIQKVYKEIQRVLVPGGKFLFMEHVIDDRLSLIKLVQVITGKLGIWQFLYDGCRADKDIEMELRKSGFGEVDAKRFRLDLKEGVPLIAVYFVEPHLYGVATTKK